MPASLVAERFGQAVLRSRLTVVSADRIRANRENGACEDHREPRRRSHGASVGLAVCFEIELEARRGLA